MRRERKLLEPGRVKGVKGGRGAGNVGGDG